MATILVVDDDAPSREFLVTLLGYAGHRTHEAADGVEGLSRAAAERPDLVLADLLMPTMDGFEFVRRLRADPILAATPVIFVTATYLESEARALATACGVEHIVTKPAEPQTILDIVSKALSVAPVPVAPPAIEVFREEHLRLVTNKLSR